MYSEKKTGVSEQKIDFGIWALARSRSFWEATNMKVTSPWSLDTGDGNEEIRWRLHGMEELIHNNLNDDEQASELVMS